MAAATQTPQSSLVLPRAGAVPLILGLFSVAYGVLSLMPGAWPSWPAASAGLLAMGAATFPGHPLLRGGGAFLGLVGLVIGAAQIAGLWVLGSAMT